MITPKHPQLSARDLRIRKNRLQLQYDEEWRLFIKRSGGFFDDGSDDPPPTPLPSSIPPTTTPASRLTNTSSVLGSQISQSSPSRDPPPAPPAPPSGASSGQACLSPGSTVTYIDANGTAHNYTNLGGNCLGLDVGESSTPNLTVQDDHPLHDPFFASISPQILALAGATIAAAILLILLFLTRTRKPWVQKLATLAMTVSLVIYMVVSVDMLQDQYANGSYDADTLRDVNQNLACKVFAYIADFVIYLAQVQTLMRIFPRKRDKVIIQWTGLGLILLTMVFCALFQFLQPTAPPPNKQSTAWAIFIQILPPLNYLFSIALAFIYAVCVFYFGVVHRRVALTVPAGLILAFLSFICITMPIIFFCLDIWAKFVVGWGQYIRSIASIGSAVIVWEWIDRVDESESKRIGKNAILGRRIFEDEFDNARVPKSPSSDSFQWLEWGKKVHIFSGISEKASEWSMKLQSKLDRRAPTPPPQPVTQLALSTLDSASSPRPGGSESSPLSNSDDTRTTTTGDDAFTGTSNTVTSAASVSPLVGAKRPKKKHHYPIARTANRTRQLALTSSSTQSPQLERTRESVFESSVTLEPSAPSIHTSDRDSLHDRPASSNAPSFHSRESEDQRARLSVLPGFTTGDYFIEPGEMEKRGWTGSSRTE
jgi:ABC-type multidrug transport system fused ATPase/permease subunit